MEKSNVTSLAQEILKLIQNNNLDINKCIAKCYDGASIMSGVYSYVQQKISEIFRHFHEAMDQMSVNKLN